MDQNVLQNLDLNSNLNPKDLELFNQILNSGGKKNKIPKMSAKDKNNLINQLSSSNTINDIPHKELKDMNEEEKNQYKMELRKKLKNKQNQKIMLRTSNFNKKNTNNTIEKLSEIMKDIDPNALNQELNQELNQGLNLGLNQELNNELNNESNQSKQLEQNSESNENNQENFEDYLK